jgi:hypothetical protein
MIFTRRKKKKKPCITPCFSAVSDAMETRKRHNQSKVKQTPWQNCRDRFIRCKEKAKEKRIKRRRDEKYLGKITFSDELRRSFDEFILIVKHDFGFLPYYCHE